MTVSAISNFIPPNLSSTQKDFERQAIKIFGENLAQDLKIKDRSWKKLMLSWNVFHTVCTVIKNSNIDFSEEINPVKQSDNGLIFDISLNSDVITKAKLITPFGYISIQCEDTEVIDRFIKCLEEKFYKKPFQDSDHCFYAEYSFTLSPKQTASIKSVYDASNSLANEEIGKFAFTRSHGITVCNIAKELLNMNIRGIPAQPRTIPYIPQYVSIGIQTGDSYTCQMQNYNGHTFSSGYDTC